MVWRYTQNVKAMEKARKKFLSAGNIWVVILPPSPWLLVPHWWRVQCNKYSWFGFCNPPSFYSPFQVAYHRTSTQEQKNTISGSTQQFKIVFDRPCHIIAKEKYTLWVKLTGPDSYQGKYSVCVNCDDFTFVFHKSGLSNNGTNISSGQIPGILCSMER